MKRYTQGMLGLALALSLASSAQAYTSSYIPGSGINSTVHDLSRTDTGMNYTANPTDTLNRICIFCHAPHNTYRLFGTGIGAGPEAPPEFDYLPLWNHEIQSQEYVMYDNGPGAPQTGQRASQAILNGMTPGSTSLLCLSCHDGILAVNSYGNGDQLTRSQSGGGMSMTPTYTIGQDAYLGNHHPIGFSYEEAWDGDPELREANVAKLTPTTFISDHLYGYTGTLECGTCHSVHNKGNDGETLLWRSDQNSELCLTCHDKGLYTAP